LRKTKSFDKGKDCALHQIAANITDANTEQSLS